MLQKVASLSLPALQGFSRISNLSNATPSYCKEESEPKGLCNKHKNLVTEFLSFDNFVNLLAQGIRKCYIGYKKFGFIMS